jgi:hypothetical protein
MDLETLGRDRLPAIQVGDAAGAAHLPVASAHLGQHARYSGCGDRVEVALQVLLRVVMLGGR